MGARAAAAFLLAREAEDEDGRRRWLMDAENYLQESLEHAAMTEDLDFAGEVLATLDAARRAAVGAH